MKKKLLSTLLAVCLFVGIAVPTVFASGDYSSQAGQESEITKLAFNKSAYDVKNGGDALNLLKEVNAFCGSTKLADGSSLEFSMSSTVNFSLSGYEVYALENSGSATITAKTSDGKFTATTTINAKPQSYATGFMLKTSSIQVPIGEKAGDFSFEVAPSPSGSKFTSTQAADVASAFHGTIRLTDGNGVTATSSAGDTVNENGNIEVKFNGSDLQAITRITKQGDNADNKFTVEFPFTRANGSNTTQVKRSFSVSTVEAVPAKIVGIKGGASSLTLKVGESKDLASMVQFGPSNSNTNKKVSYSTDFATSNSSADDYAIVSDEGVIKGIAVGENKIIVTLDSTGQTASVLVKVVPASTQPTTDAPKISMTSATMTVDELTTLSVTNSGDSTITWTSSDTAIATVSPETGKATKVTAHKAGSVVVTAYMDDVEVGKCTITVKEAATTPPPAPVPTPDVPITSNPQTGDNWFASLFF